MYVGCTAADCTAAELTGVKCVKVEGAVMLLPVFIC